MVDRGAVDRGTTIARLKKTHVERLLAEYDADPIAALTTALGIALDRLGADWPALLHAAPIDADRRQRLLAGTEADLDALAAELNEYRSLDEPRSNMPASRREAGGGSAPPTGTSGR
jgi:hypothetical protein